MSMSTSSSTPFVATADSRDAIAVLVLIESSGMMHNLWDNIRAYYLPLLLDNIRANKPTVSMRVCWQTTTGQSRRDSTGSVVAPNTGIPTSSHGVPPISFDSSTLSSISAVSLRFAIETLRVAQPQAQRPYRHLIVIAANTPLQDLSGTQAMHGIALSMFQNDVRLHMVLSSGPQVQPLRELYQRTLHLHQSPAITPAFEVDTSQYQILLSGDPAPSPGNRSVAAPIIPAHGSLSLPSQSPPRPGAVRTLSAPSAVATSSSLVDTPVQETLLAAIPRVPRGKQPASSPPTGPSEPPRTGLVSYLQQMHGLTKKRTYGTKSSKRSGGGSMSPSTTSGTGESSRSTINRPILPRLDLSATKQPHGRPPYPKATSSDLERSPPKSTAVSQTTASSSSTTAASASTSTSQSHRGNTTPRRFPWILPTSLPEPSSGQAVHSASASAALRSLASMSLRQPDFAAHGPGPSHSHDSRTSPTGNSPPQQLLTRGTQSIHREMSHTMQGGSSSAIHSIGTSSSNLISTAQFGPGWGTSQFHEYASHPHDLHAGHSQYGSMAPVEDPGDQPFIITPEYEARVDAEFTAALRSGAIEAQMTSATLSPTAESHQPLGYSTQYFPNTTHSQQNPASSSMIPSPASMTGRPHMQVPLSQGYYYEAQGATYTSQDDPSNVEHEDQAHPASSSGSSSHHQYHDHPNYDSSADRWYGT